MRAECLPGSLDRKQSQKWPHKALTGKGRDPFCGRGRGLRRALAVAGENLALPSTWVSILQSLELLCLPEDKDT